MSLRKGLAAFVVAIALLVLSTVNATPSHAQSDGDNATATAALYKTVSIKPTKFGIHADKGYGIQADRGAKTTPNEVTVTNSTAQEIIRDAYDVKEDQIVGAPAWLNSPRYDIVAKINTAAEGEDTQAGEALEERGNPRLQALLSNGFKLTVHRETSLIPAYELIVAGDGSKLRDQIPPKQIPLLVLFKLRADG